MTMSQIIIPLAALLLLPLQAVASSTDIAYERSQVLQDEEDAQPELCMLQMGANARQRKHDHGQAKSLLHQNCTGSAEKPPLRKVHEAKEQGKRKQHTLAESVQTSKVDEKPGQLKPSPKHSSRLKQEPAEEGATTAAPIAEAATTGAAEVTPEPTAEPAVAPEATTAAPEPLLGTTTSELPPELQPAMERPDSRKEEYYAEIASEIKEAKIVSCVLFSMIVVFMVIHIMHEYDIHLLPEAVMIILVGVLLGLVLKYWCESRMMFDAEYRSEIAIQLLNEVFLPMLMLEAGWSVRRMDFISQLPYILNFAVLGTIISTLVIAGLLYKTGQANLHQITTFRGSFVVAALISATDPVATLATYSDLKVDPLLNIIVFGEAAINDAVAIVVFTLVNDDYLMSAYDSPYSMVIFGTFRGIQTLSCSFGLGALTSFAVCLCLRMVGMHRNKKLEILVVVLGGYLSYALGEYFRVSGIICTLFNGMFMGKYAKYHLSTEGSLLTSFYISQMSTIMDAGVFLLSGVCCICLSWSGRTLGLWLMAFGAIARVCSTIPCGLITNWMKTSMKANPNASQADMHILTSKYLFMIWHAGLRGGIAENLALQIGDWFDVAEGEGAKESVRSGVFLMVAAYVVIFGGTTKMFLSVCGITMNHEYSEDALSKTELNHVEGAIINWLHSRVFFPMLVGTSVSAENMDNVGDMGDCDVLDVLHTVCESHRGGTMRKDGNKKVGRDRKSVV